MANKEISLENKTEENVENFINRNRKVILAVVGAIVVIAIAVSVFFGVSANVSKKNIDSIDAIEYSYIKNSSALSDEEVATRQALALDALKPYVSKKSVAGVRANMLSAEIAYAQKNYAEAFSYYLSAAEAGKKSYTAPLNYYNAAVCAEELGKDDDAVKYYEKAISYSDFLLKSHALFSVGRVNESLNNYEAAAEAYQKLIDSYTDTWSDLAHSRIIDLRSKGLIN